MIASLMVLSCIMAAPSVDYTECTDRAFCYTGCHTTTVTSETCLTFGNASEIFHCLEEIDVCGDLSYFTDSQCTSLFMTSGFVCDKCNQGDGVSSQSIRCRSRDNVQYLTVDVCDAVCGKCVTVQNVTVNQCSPTTMNGQNVFFRYTGVVPCSVSFLQQYPSSSSCNPKAPGYREMWFPQNSCLNGSKLVCKY